MHLGYLACQSFKSVFFLTRLAQANGKVGSLSEPIKVKTFEEIMREKRLRKQQQEELDTSTILKEVESPAASPPAPVSTTQTSVRQRITIKPKTSPPPTAVVPQQKSPERPVCSSTDLPKAPTPAPMPDQVAEGTIQTTETKGNTSDVQYIVL